MTKSHNITRQQFAGWILAIVPAGTFAVAIFGLPGAIHRIAAGSSALTECWGLFLPVAIMLGIFVLAIGLIKNDSVCRLALALYSALFFAIGVAAPITGLVVAPGHGSLIIGVPIAHPTVFHYALFFLIYFLIYFFLFGIPLWLLLRRPTAPLFGHTPRAAA